jgi:RNA polymerase sigma-70 factor (ECF subfamily)
MNDDPPNDKSGLFPTTAWDVLREAQAGGVDAMNGIITAYWRPVFYCIRTAGYRPAQAEELTQAFFVRFWQRGMVHAVDRERGRFRGFLRGALTFFLRDQYRQRVQEQFEGRLVSVGTLMTEEDRTWEPAVHETPETTFDRRWARELLNRVKKNLKRLCRNRGQPLWYDIFAATHFAAERTSQRDLAEQLGVSRDEVRKAQDEVLEWFKVKFREQVLKEVGSEADIDQEIAELLDALKG